MYDWLTDRYAVTAGDVAAQFASRGYSTVLGKWMTLPALAITPAAGKPPDYRLREVYLTVSKATGGYRAGIRVFVCAHVDPMHRDFVIPLIDDVRGGKAGWDWAGNVPMGAGVVWRIVQNALVATDEVWMTVLYEH